jgi:hypothetical protein
MAYKRAQLQGRAARRRYLLAPIMICRIPGKTWHGCLIRDPEITSPQEKWLERHGYHYEDIGEWEE